MFDSDAERRNARSTASFTPWGTYSAIAAPVKNTVFCAISPVAANIGFIELDAVVRALCVEVTAVFVTFFIVSVADGAIGLTDWSV